MIDDGDDDGLLFDEIDDTVEGELANTNCLVVGACPPKEMLCALEEQYRREGLPPVQFLETDDNGAEVFGNALEYAKLMKLPPDVLPTMEQADAWVASRRWASLEW